MKIKIKLAKPRNRLALQARSRRAGAHAGEQPQRLARRTAKHQLHLLLAGRDKEGKQ